MKLSLEYPYVFSFDSTLQNVLVGSTNYAVIVIRTTHNWKGFLPAVKRYSEYTRKYF